MKDIKQLDFYCKNCRKSMKMSYSISGDDEVSVLPGMIIRCHTNKCTRVMILKKYTERMLILQANKESKVFI